MAQEIKIGGAGYYQKNDLSVHQVVYTVPLVDAGIDPNYGVVNVYKQISSMLISSETAIWTPASGKRFRLMGAMLSCTIASGNISLIDGTGGPTIWIIPAVVVGTLLLFSLPGDGILSSGVNKALRAQGVSLQILNGVVWGREE